MRLHFQETPWDLYAALGYTSIVSAVLLARGIGDLVAILFVLFVPGYLLVAALFPSSDEIDWVERIALSLGLSLVIVPALMLPLNFTPVGIRFGPVIVTTTVFSFLAGITALWRRKKMPIERRLAASLEFAPAFWRTYSNLDRITTVGLASSIVVASGVLAYLLTTPQPDQPSTDFYVLGPGGNASTYPTHLNISQGGSVLLGIKNAEGRRVNYGLRVDLVGISIVYNSTSGSNQTIESNRTTWSEFNVTLSSGQEWTQNFSFSIPYVGLWKVQFFLFKDGDFTSLFRENHLYVSVT